MFQKECFRCFHTLLQGLTHFENSSVILIGEFWTYSHESNFVRLLVLLQHGGIYLDTDIVLVKSLQVPFCPFSLLADQSFFQAKSFRNSIAYEMEDGGRLNNNVLIFDPGHWFLVSCLQV